MRNGGVASGPEALRVLYREASSGDPYRIVILDMQMPDMDGMAVARAVKADPPFQDLKIVILTSLAHHPDEIGFRAAGISAYLTKPVKPSRLYDCLATVLGETPAAAATRRGSPSTAVTAPPGEAEAPAPKKRSPIRILLAEDNSVNQKVALRQLNKLGYNADAAANGAEALRAVERARYDLILMDCQMPEMDGYEATRQIRLREQTVTGGIPHQIIAITAYALNGDRERCLEAGMNDYLSKPIRIEDLAIMLERSVAIITAQT